MEIFGHKESDGSWSFTGRCTSLVIEDDGDESVAVSDIPRFADLAVGLPQEWILFMPTLVHPELRAWFRDRYAAAVASLPQELQKSQMGFRDRTWQALFAATPPDGWSGEDEL